MRMEGMPTYLVVQKGITLILSFTSRWTSKLKVMYRSLSGDAATTSHPPLSCRQVSQQDLRDVQIILKW
jgi:hypothetical protein